MAEINIDATNAIVGRIGTFAAKQALLGNTINVFNCEKAVISGRPAAVKAKYHHDIFGRGRPRTGPFPSRMPDRFVRRIIRGMLGHRRGRGKDAYGRVMCYIGVPVAFKDKKLVKVAKESSALPSLRYQTIGELCVSLGGKV